MSLWTRTSPLDAAQERQQETWSLTSVGGQAQSFQLDVKTGKPLDVMGLKNSSLAETREYAEMLASRAMKLYGPGMTLRSPISLT